LELIGAAHVGLSDTKRTCVQMMAGRKPDASRGRPPAGKEVGNGSGKRERAKEEDGGKPGVKKRKLGTGSAGVPPSYRITSHSLSGCALACFSVVPVQHLKPMTCKFVGLGSEF